MKPIKVMSERLTDEQVEQEIARLQADENVKLGRLEERIKYHRRQYLYMLRMYRKKGIELRAQGITEENLRNMDYNTDEEDDYGC